MKLSIVIPNYNGINIIPPLLSDLDRINKLNPSLDLEVIVTDDCSTDGSLEWIQSEFPWVKTVKSIINTGFGSNVNRGVEYATGEYLCICNNDIRISDSHVIDTLISAIESNPKAFAAMPQISATGLGSIIENINWLRSSRGLAWLERVASLADIPKGKELILCGAFFVCRRADFVSLKGFDPAYNPAYWEDVDLSLRANAAGKRILLEENCLVLHEHSKTMNSVFGDRWKFVQLLRNQLILCKIHSAVLQLGCCYRLWYLLRALKWVLKGDREVAILYWKALFGR